MNRYFLSIGSNIQPALHVPRCLKFLSEKFRVVKTSSVYETEPVGPVGKNKFWNLAVEIESELSHAELLHALRAIEESLGRKRDPKNKYAPRTIDLDILPQPDYQSAAFIMIPLAEIAPDVRDAETGDTFEQLAEKLKEGGRAAHKIKPNPLAPNNI